MHHRWVFNASHNTYWKLFLLGIINSSRLIQNSSPSLAWHDLMWNDVMWRLVQHIMTCKLCSYDLNVIYWLIFRTLNGLFRWHVIPFHSKYTIFFYISVKAFKNVLTACAKSGCKVWNFAQQNSINYRHSVEIKLLIGFQALVLENLQRWIMRVRVIIYANKMLERWLIFIKYGR